MTNDEITQLYRQIGRELRELGAERIFLLSSKYKEVAETNAQLELRLELAVTGEPDKKVWKQKQKMLWPFLEIQTYYAEEELDGALDVEIIEDSIQL